MLLSLVLVLLDSVPGVKEVSPVVKRPPSTPVKFNSSNEKSTSGGGRFNSGAV